MKSSRFDWEKIYPLMGTMSDEDLGSIIQASDKTVQARRKRAGIPVYVAPMPLPVDEVTRLLRMM